MNSSDQSLKELLALEAEVKPKLKRIEEIKTWCKDQGSFATLHYVCAVIPRQRTCLVSLDKAVTALGKEMLESFNLIQTVTFSIVNVSEKSVVELAQDDALENF